MEHLPSLGPLGQLITLVLFLFLAIITWRQQQWRTAAKAAQSALAVSKEELIAWKERGERIRQENRELLEESKVQLQAIASLRARTDLQPLVEIVASWTAESRSHFLQAMERLNAIHIEQTEHAQTVIRHLEELTRKVLERT